jgi:hypothetical protein
MAEPRVERPGRVERMPLCRWSTAGCRGLVNNVGYSPCLSKTLGRRVLESAASDNLIPFLSYMLKRLNCSYMHKARTGK